MKKNDIKNSADMFLYKANIDFNSARHLYSLFNRDEVDIDIEKVYFDLQQSVEKLLKALLSYHKINVPKIHDINKLIKDCINNNILLIENVELLIDLSDYAVEGRYDIICDNIEEADDYFLKVEELLLFTKKYLGDKI